MGKTGNGNYVVLEHKISGKIIYSFYAHLSSYNVRSGDKVAKGTKIGVVGSTGNSSGPHLHFAIVDKLKDGNYFGYTTYFFGNETVCGDVRYYNPVYVIQNNKLP